MRLRAWLCLVGRHERDRVLVPHGGYEPVGRCHHCRSYVSDGEDMFYRMIILSVMLMFLSPLAALYARLTEPKPAVTTELSAEASVTSKG